MKQAMSYMQYREPKSLAYQLRCYLPYCFLIGFIITILVVAEYLRIDWNRLLFQEIGHVRIEGEYKRIDRFQIERLLSPFLGSTIKRTQMDAIEKILKELPWIKDVFIKHSWLDGTLVVTIQEREAVAYWGGQALLDRDAEVFVPSLIDHRNLPILDAASGREKHILEFYRQLNEWLIVAGLQIIHVREDRSRAYTVQLDNAPRLILGRHLFEQRIKRFIAAYKAGFANYMHHVACIDLRYLDGFAVRWKKDGVLKSC